ncbi:TPA: copper resistance protein B [Stenotrophomonas maltophilia]|nr:copper resistance protein B [Stenotrophomonas maltophilia]HDS1027107.1 copper resistance protein B [Stenotrophomonas maltophilia]HDS1031318.1 copper resistance protein B [Stenotrophomonas maltophilia]HDS1035982.1 copper resistance protein B [Stenotrophomonas maltophilia]
MSRSLSCSLLALGLAAALPAFAQSHDAHAGHDMATPAKAPVDHSKMDHSKMDHSSMDHGAMDHSAMGHDMPMTALSEPREPIPVPTDADRAAAFPPIDHGAMEHAPEINSLLLIDRLEQWDGNNASGQAWEASGWIGGNINRLWLRSDGERSDGRTGSSSLEALYGRSVSPWWDVLVGVRQDFRPADSRTWAAIGLQGLAPYKFESSATLYLGSGGQVLAKAEVEYDVLLTNRLILQPLLEATVAAKDEPEYGIGRGLNKVEAGLRLRYEISRRFAPYIGISHERSFGDAADYAGDHARDTRWVAGVRMWF